MNWGLWELQSELAWKDSCVCLPKKEDISSFLRKPEMFALRLTVWLSLPGLIYTQFENRTNKLILVPSVDFF